MAKLPAIPFRPNCVEILTRRGAEFLEPDPADQILSTIRNHRRRITTARTGELRKLDRELSPTMQ